MSRIRNERDEKRVLRNRAQTITVLIVHFEAPKVTSGIFYSPFCHIQKLAEVVRSTRGGLSPMMQEDAAELLPEAAAPVWDRARARPARIGATP